MSRPNTGASDTSSTDSRRSRSTTSSAFTTSSHFVNDVEQRERARAARAASREAGQTWTATGKPRARTAPVHKPLRTNDENRLADITTTATNANKTASRLPASKPAEGPWPVAWPMAGENNLTKPNVIHWR